MTRADITERIQANTGFSKIESTDMLDAVLSILKDTLEAGENVNVTGFGNFEVKEKKDRQGRNPITGEAITINARKILTFKPSGLLKTAVNGCRDEVHL